MELEDNFIDGNLKFPRESEPTAEQEACLTPKTCKKCAALADIDTNIKPADKEAGEKPRKKQNRGTVHVTSYLRKSNEFHSNPSRLSVKTCAEISRTYSASLRKSASLKAYFLSNQQWLTCTIE